MKASESIAPTLARPALRHSIGARANGSQTRRLTLRDAGEGKPKAPNRVECRVPNGDPA